MTETRIDFSELISRFENAVQTDFKFELLEFHYVPYSFGSGMKAYRINGRAVKLVYDGRDYLATLYISEKHITYSRAEWTEIFSGTASGLLAEGIPGLKIYLV
ncbi:MAG: hypothetical protein ABI763_01315 [Bacteroidota bacterium]